MNGPVAKGRGSASNPPNRFERIHMEGDLDQLESEEDFSQIQKAVYKEYFDDDAKTIISTNDSPDVPFRFSLNPYRGCSYWYAQPKRPYDQGQPFLQRTTEKVSVTGVFADG